ITGGRAFILFTSLSSLMSVYESTSEKLKSKNINALAQTASVHRHTLLDMFKSSSNNVLYGVDSFWEGVDVAGKNLEAVIIPKLPFAVPTDPISEGRYKYIEENGGNAFLDYALPFAVIKFKQGFGRLIRSKDDRGIVLVLDKRLYTKNYGSQFINSLPNAKVLRGSIREILNDMNNFFDY
ncbi:helicase C-terminal domain-containing protein, partial [uncultured Brachyspira sp.]|uniref:ATP-dependent DNA helicase n=1 Tax=uncultured Brachyspira sp. TaxID=221953 RepID=UPI002603A344